MGSDVIFDSLCLDRCLRSGCLLYIVMFLLLGDAFLMVRFVSAVFGLPGSCVCWWMIWCCMIFWSTVHPMPYRGIFMLSDEIYRALLICMIIPSYGMRVRLRIRSYSVMTLRMTFPCFVSSSSHFPVSMWFPDGVVSGSWILASSFRQVHVGSSVHPHRVSHESSGQIGYTWCYTGAYFPHLAMEAFVLSHVRYSFHHSAGIYGIHLAGPLFLSSSSMWALSGASFETRRAPFSHSQRIQICSSMPHWGIPTSLSSSDLLRILPLLDLLLDLHGSSHWGTPPSFSLSGLLCTSSPLGLFLDLCE